MDDESATTLEPEAPEEVQSAANDEREDGGDPTPVRDPRAAELFFTSHIYESPDGGEDRGWGGILDKDAVKLIEKTATKRDRHTREGGLLFPSDKPKLIAEFSTSLRGLIEPHLQSPPDTGPQLIVSPDGDTLLRTDSEGNVISIEILTPPTTETGRHPEG